MPRTFSLTRTKDGIRLVNQPVPELQTLRRGHWNWQDETIRPGTNLLANLRGETLEIVAEFQMVPSPDRLGFRVRVGEGECTTISYAVSEQKFLVDRTHSGQSAFNDGFAQIHQAKPSPSGDILRLHILVDRTSVEVFGNDGLINFTDLIFPHEESQGVELFVEGGSVVINRLDIFQLDPVEFRHQEDR